MKRTNGWDERDYKLWSALGTLQSYGRKDRTDHLVSLAEVEQLLRKQAEERYEKEKSKSLQDMRTPKATAF
jgi:hypothetical protein